LADEGDARTEQGDPEADQKITEAQVPVFHDLLAKSNQPCHHASGDGELHGHAPRPDPD
jgi:hypothetical protein